MKGLVVAGCTVVVALGAVSAEAGKNRIETINSNLPYRYYAPVMPAPVMQPAVVQPTVAFSPVASPCCPSMAPVVAPTVAYSPVAPTVTFSPVQPTIVAAPIMEPTIVQPQRVAIPAWRAPTPPSIFGGRRAAYVEPGIMYGAPVVTMPQPVFVP